MRDPDLMQRADRAAITLEQAWERWRGMHGIGTEPLPPVSSYVGYSLEEPWGQPRVVFGLRADEAELLASLLEGHDCAGSVYADLSPLSGRRASANGLSMPGRGYGGPFSVPAQAPSPEAGLLGPDLAEESAIGADPEGDDALAADAREDDADAGRPASAAAAPGSARGRAAQGDRGDRARRRASEPGPDPADDSEAGWPATGDTPPSFDCPAEAGSAEAGVPQSAPLTPLPDMPEFRARTDEPGAAGSDEQTVVPPRGAGTTRVPAQGPGYRGPRYRGFPPRYEPGSASPASAAPADNGTSAEQDSEPEPVRKPPYARVSRSARRRLKSD